MAKLPNYYKVSVDGLTVKLDPIYEEMSEVVHGRWEDNHCTVCGMMPMGEELWERCDFAPPKMERFMDYCPCCGAKMDLQNITEQTVDALNRMGEKAHGGNDDG